MRITNVSDDVSADYWEGLRKIYASKTGVFLRRAIPDIADVPIRFVPHRVVHAASA